jgi:uncharacterized membrane protein YvlD (DUF360 family)
VAFGRLRSPLQPGLLGEAPPRVPLTHAMTHSHDEESARRGVSSGRRALGFAARAAIMLVLDGLLLWGLSEVLAGIAVPSFGAALLTAGVIALLNAVLWPVITRLALPFTLLTLGLGSLVLNAFVIILAFELVDNAPPSFGAAVVVAAALAIAGMLVTPLLDFDGDAYNLRVVRRRVRRGRAGNETDVPGVILFEFDGLGEEILREAARSGYAPTIARWLEEGSHRVVGWECDLSSQTGASQAGLLLGSNWDMPAFRWYEKESGRTLVSNHPPDAAEMERRHSGGGGLLAAGGTSRGNMFSGGAPRCSATMSVVRDRKRSRAGDFFAYFSDPYGFIRTIALSLADIAEERLAARRQRRSGAEHVDRGGVYPLVRAAIAVVMRDLTVATLMADIVEGIPVSYATFVGYDEVAHHSGIREPDALKVLRRHDRQLARLERAIAQAPRPYHLVALSDHGQTQGRPFRQRYGQTLEELVKGLLASGHVHSPAAVDESWGDLGAVLADAREDESAGGRILRRATRKRTMQGTVALGPNRDALSEQAEPSEGDVVVMVSGPLGLVYHTASSDRLTFEQIVEAHPRLISELAGHPGIGFVMVRSQTEGALVIGAGGRRRLTDDSVDGEDPLAPFGPRAADHLRRHDSFPHCPDLLVNSAYDPDKDEVGPFEEFMGSHGGLGGPQMRPVAVVPSSWSAPTAPIVGDEAMHRALLAWLAETGLQPQAAPANLATLTTPASRTAGASSAGLTVDDGSTPVPSGANR